MPVDMLQRHVQHAVPHAWPAPAQPLVLHCGPLGAPDPWMIEEQERKRREREERERMPIRLPLYERPPEDMPLPPGPPKPGSTVVVIDL